jgi:hypothetical protein
MRSRIQSVEAMTGRVGVLILAIAMLIAGNAIAVTIGQIDTFQSGTTEGWVAGGGPLGQVPPVPPHAVTSGGPGGSSDAYLVITSQGGSGPGSRLTAFNIFGQWAGNYLASGIGAIAMDLNNLASTELTIRIEFENPFAGGDEAVTNTGITLNPGWFWCKRWESVSWPVRSPICDYSAVRAAQIAGIVFGRPGRLPTLNWCFLILAASSMPLIVTAAVSKRLKPSIGLIRCFTRR